MRLGRRSARTCRAAGAGKPRVDDRTVISGILYLRGDSVRIGSSHPAIVGIPVASLL